MTGEIREEERGVGKGHVGVFDHRQGAGVGFEQGQVGTCAPTERMCCRVTQPAAKGCARKCL